MDKLQNLSCLSGKKFQDFVEGFDVVLTDCDGVLYFLDRPLPGSVDAVKQLKELNKTVRFVSNNSTMSLERFHHKLNKLEFEAECDDILFPTISIIEYLRQINFDKSVYILGFEAMKQEITNAGFVVADSGNLGVEEKLAEFKEETQDNPEIGAVIIDMDLNISYIKLTRALTYLRRPEVLFLAGASDYIIPLGNDTKLLGPGYFLSALEEFGGRKATLLGKPSVFIKEIIFKKFAIKDPKRVLFIGDALYQDMSFAKLCGFQSLFVLSGINSLVDAKALNEDKRPDYYINNLQEFHQLLKEC